VARPTASRYLPGQALPLRETGEDHGGAEDVPVEPGVHHRRVQEEGLDAPEPFPHQGLFQGLFGNPL